MINGCVIGLFSFILAMAFHDFHTLQISVTCFLNILFFSVCYCHVTYLFHSEYLLYSCLNVKELFTRNRRDIWSLSNNNGTGWLNGWVFVYELSGRGLKSHWRHLNFKYRSCFEQGVPWHSGNYRLWIHSKTCAWHDRNIQSNALHR